MKRVMSSTPGLCVNHERVWLFVMRFAREKNRGPSSAEIRMQFPDWDWHTRSYILKRCIKLKFMERREDGSYVALKAPHEIVIRDVCDEVKIKQHELFSRCRTRHVARARRIITRRLRACGYPVADIARLLQRNDKVVGEYLNADKMRRRNERRHAHHVASRAAEQAA